MALRARPPVAALRAPRRNVGRRRSKTGPLHGQDQTGALPTSADQQRMTSKTNAAALKPGLFARRLPPFRENRKAPIDLQRQPGSGSIPILDARTAPGPGRGLRSRWRGCGGSAPVWSRCSYRPGDCENVRTPHTRGRRPCRRRASAVAHVVTAASGSGSTKVSLRLQPRACGSGALGLSSRNAQPTTGLSGRTHSRRGTVVSWRLEASRVSSRR